MGYASRTVDYASRTMKGLYPASQASCNACCALVALMKVTMPVTSMMMKVLKVFIRLSLYFKGTNTLTDARVFD